MNTIHKTYFFAVVGVVLILAGHLGYAQSGVRQSAEPAWVRNYAFEPSSFDSSASSDGYAYLYVSVQRHLETQEAYNKYAIRVLSEEGLSLASSINISFDPSYQRLYLHSLNIIRKGATINKLDVNKFEVLRREDEMERAVYDKTLNAIYNMPDVRVGDVVEYAYTVKGFNPVFGDHMFGSLYFQYSDPVAKVVHRLVHSSNRTLQIRSYGDTGDPTFTERGETKSYEWTRDNVPAVLKDDRVPSWYDAFAHIQYTDFKSWSEVKTWARTIFDLPKPNDAALNDLVKEIVAAYKTDEDRIKECIRVVQGDIRYLSFSDGIHGYKPHSPEYVFDHKYGDCKDKSQLLSYLLGKIGIESYPALVSTQEGKTLPDILPNPWAFNHCIVQFNFRDSSYWLDPTLDPQVGALDNYFVPTYHHALVINNAGNGLDSIPFGYKDSWIKVVEEYSMNQVGGEVTLEVTTEYRGDEADETRDFMRSNSKDEIHKKYLNFYARDYTEISLKEDVKFDDNESENIITSSEKYLVKNFWEADDDEGKIAYLYARIIASYLNTPETKLRTMPLAVTHPRNVSQTIKIYLPELWEVNDFTTTIESDAFSYHSSGIYNGETITLRYVYRTKQSFVPAEKTSEHIKKIGEVVEDLNYWISKSDSTDATENSHSTAIVVIVFVVAVGIILMRIRRG